MNEFKGTPGPWQTAKPRVKQNGLFVEIDIQSTNTATLICTVKKDIGFTTAEDVERNAQLISKAPEMLALLKGIADEICTLLDDNDLTDEKLREFSESTLPNIHLQILNQIKEAANID